MSGLLEYFYIKSQKYFKRPYEFRYFFDITVTRHAKILWKWKCWDEKYHWYLSQKGMVLK
ncbi:hypothetical protein GCWU000282_02104 [Catonella morbi ATCC 51271]|uniref:Uncharacterized protein n=1 Tax=Catonella morbi ATCC 51271 TaxID=592026 RepID=V2Z8H3_9FIRM|nr:hypothetical protein GCWU000282_02104 [Catonella morbi ATCC 51271]